MWSVKDTRDTCVGTPPTLASAWAVAAGNRASMTEVVVADAGVAPLTAAAADIVGVTRDG
jgi:hypothetical protein